jgi:NurA-like 5'-3' nuclease
MEDKTARLAVLGLQLLDLNDQANEIEDERLSVKDEIAGILKDLNQDLVYVELGDDKLLIFKNHKRTTKSFDKSSLATDYDLDIDKLDYPGIADFTEKGKIHAYDVAKYLKRNPCEFVTVRSVYKKKGRD